MGSASQTRASTLVRNSSELYPMTNPRWWLSLLGLGLLAACEQRQSAATLETSGPTVATVPSAKAKLPSSDSVQARTQALLALYRTYPLPLPLSTKRLYHDSLETDTVDMGVPISDRLLKLFGKRIHHVKGEEDAFALAQVLLANGSIALATRVLNSDKDGRTPYKVQLFVFDPRQQRIVTSCHIGEYITGLSTAFIREATIRQQPGQSLFIDMRQRITTILG